MKTCMIFAAALLVVSAPAAGQKTSSPVDDATAMHRAGRSVADVAAMLRAEHRQSGDMLVSTLSRAGYPPGDVASHMIRLERVAPGETALWLTREGLDAGTAFAAVHSGSGQPAREVALAVVEHLGVRSVENDASLDRAFRDHGLSVTDVVSVFTQRQTGLNGSRTTQMSLAEHAAQLQAQGLTGAQIAQELRTSRNADDATIIEVLADLGFTAVEVVLVARDVLGRVLSWEMVQLMLAEYEAWRVGVALADAFPQSAAATELAAEAGALGINVYLVTDVLVGLVWTPTVGTFALIPAAALSTVAAALVAGGYGVDIVTGAFAQHGIGYQTSAGALMETQTIPLNIIAQVLVSVYQVSVVHISQSLIVAGAPAGLTLLAIRDAAALSVDELIELVLELQLQDDADASAAMFGVIAQSGSLNGHVDKLAEAGMSAAFIAGGLADTGKLGIDAIAAAVGSAFPNAVTVALALKSAGFTNALEVAQALNAAGFSVAQVQTALVNAFTLTAQQIAEIMGQVFG